MVLNIMPMLIFQKRRFILAILNVVFFFFLSRYLPLCPSPSVLVKVPFSLVAEVKDPHSCYCQRLTFIAMADLHNSEERFWKKWSSDDCRNVYVSEHSTVLRRRTKWELATSGDWLAINNAMGTLTIQLMFSRAFHTCFHEITAWTLHCLVGSDGRTAGTAEQLYFFSSVICYLNKEPS